MDLSQLAGDEKRFLSRLADLHRQCEEKRIPRFTAFLDDRQIAIAKTYLTRSRCEQYLFYGGFPDAARKVLGFFPDRAKPDEKEFPITVVAVRYYKTETPCHRDFLGALIHLGVSRESVGDIPVGEGCAHLFLSAAVSGAVLEELRRVGRAAVRCEAAAGLQGLAVQQYVAFRGTVCSLRVDSLVSVATGLSREKSAALIAADMVRQNGAAVRSASGAFDTGDKLSVRGYGKYIVDTIGAPTKKNRLPVSGRKFL